MNYQIPAFDLFSQIPHTLICISEEIFPIVFRNDRFNFREHPRADLRGILDAQRDQLQTDQMLSLSIKK